MMKSQKIDMSNLVDVTGGNKALIAKYIRVFLETCPEHLRGIETALATGNKELLYSSLHTLKSQVELMGLKEILPRVQAILENLRTEKKITEPARETSLNIAREINLACNELDAIRKDLA